MNLGTGNNFFNCSVPVISYAQQTHLVFYFKMSEKWMRAKGCQLGFFEKPNISAMVASEWNVEFSKVDVWVNAV